MLISGEAQVQSATGMWGPSEPPRERNPHPFLHPKHTAMLEPGPGTHSFIFLKAKAQPWPKTEIKN